MIAILMATYNGEKYLAEQLDSLLAQTLQDFVVYIQDDCSTDETFEILRDYARKYPDKFFISQTEKNSGNAKYNFMDMMVKHKEEYMMLCDQDDVWLPNKIENTFRVMQQLEQTYGKDTPLLVYTDLEVVDEFLNIKNPSYFKMAHLDASRVELAQVVAQNIFTGCTGLYNMALSKFMERTPSYLVMHDWWLLLLASAFGQAGYLQTPTILYRQHGQNSVGAKNVHSFTYKIKRFLNQKEMKEALAQTYMQAGAFLQMFEECLAPQQNALLKEYAAIPQMSKHIRIQTIWKLGALKYGLSRQIATWLVI